MNRDTLRQAVNVITLAITLVVNALANSLPINDLTTAEISNSFPVLFTPASYVFAIWGLIYLGLVAFVIYQALPGQRENPRLRRVGYWFALSNLANTAWIFMWHYQQFVLTEVFMIIVLVSLIMVYERLAIGREQVSGLQRWLVNLPFSIYLGWITVATIANTTIVLFDAGWDGFGIAPAVWAAIMLVIATVITGVMIVQRGDVAYAGVIIWAFIGIVVKQSDTQLVAVTAAVMAGVVVVMLLVKYFSDRRGTGMKQARAAA